MSATLLPFRFVAGLLVAVASTSSLAGAGGPSRPDRVLRVADDPESRPAVATAVAMSADGKTIAAGGDDHVVRIWQGSADQVSLRLTGHDDWVRGLQFAADDTKLASVGADRRLCLWALQNTNQPERTSHLAGGSLASVAFHPNGQQLLTAGFRDPMRLFSLSSGGLDRTYECPCQDTRCVSVSPDGRWMAAAGRNGRLRVWDLISGLPGKDIPAATRRIHAVAFSPDSQSVATAGDGEWIRVWNVTSGELSDELPVRPAKVRALLYLGDNRLAAGGTDNAITIWDVPQQRVSRRLVGHTGAVTSLARNDASTKLVSGSYDTTICIWSIQPQADTATTATNGTLR